MSPGQVVSGTYCLPVQIVYEVDYLMADCLSHIALGQVVSGQVALGHQWIKVLLKEDKCHQANIDRTNISWQSDAMTVVTYIVIETYLKV